MDLLAKVYKRLGTPSDGVVLVHSAFKQFARDGYRAPIVLRSLVEYFERGTLLMPTMSWRYVNAANPLFDELDTPSNTGILTELFRTEYADVRSLHPTHSVAGRGKMARTLVQTHHYDETPCSSRSPFGLLSRHDAWVLMLGISMDCCTLVHFGEESVAPELYLRPSDQRETYSCRDRKGQVFEVTLRRHRFLPRDYFQFQDQLAGEGKLQVARIGNTTCRAFRAVDMVRIVTEALKQSPDAILAKPGQRYRMM
ncbi:MAG: AAC(3) family N-acetyltransferase [Nitrospirales bacterium]|nr:AAC(3) family N-acetyltransferase [Nitrospira sp.]MDR4502097.1 AAC(3) family N-acetyltransferase [Nitrospirales bacterium]